MHAFRVCSQLLSLTTRSLTPPTAQTAHTSIPLSPDHSHLKGTKRSKKGITNTSQQRIDIEFWVRKEAERRGGKVWLMVSLLLLLSPLLSCLQ
jgi:hypothetical protein